jgi:hypothetical protein
MIADWNEYYYTSIADVSGKELTTDSSESREEW